MDETKDLVVSTEEHIADEEALKEANGDELRDKLAASYGLNPEENSELLEKLVATELDYRKKLSGVIKQKISWREKATKSSKTGESQSGQSQSSSNLPDIEALVDQKLAAKLEQIELQQLSLPEELTEEVKRVAKIQGISVKEAANSDYIKYKREQHELDRRIQNATPGGKSASGLPKGFDPSKPLDPSQFKLDTEEGRKQWEAAKALNKKR